MIKKIYEFELKFIMSRATADFKTYKEFEAIRVALVLDADRNFMASRIAIAFSM